MIKKDSKRITITLSRSEVMTLIDLMIELKTKQKSKAIKYLLHLYDKTMLK